MNKETFTFDVNEELRKIRICGDEEKISVISKISSSEGEFAKKPSSKNCNEISDNSRISSASAANQYFSDKNKVEEVKTLIRNYARYWGETEENIEEYIKDQLAAFPLDGLINCFRSLNADIQHLQYPSANVAKTANKNGKC